MLQCCTVNDVQASVAWDELISGKKHYYHTVMIYHGIKKIPGGKLLRISIEAEQAIRRVAITGDFFLHPEEALPVVENSLINLPVNSAKKQFEQAIDVALSYQKATFYGLTVSDLADTVLSALEQR